jgi:hypothetical protein
MSTSLLAGLAINHEEPTGGDPAETNLEGMLRADYKVFHLRTPKLSVNTVLTAFPGITDYGRIRAGLDVKLRKEIINDFTWDLTVYANYDNRPPNPDASTNDYGIVTGFGYSF